MKVFKGYVFLTLKDGVNNEENKLVKIINEIKEGKMDKLKLNEKEIDCKIALKRNDALSKETEKNSRQIFAKTYPDPNDLSLEATKTAFSQLGEVEELKIVKKKSDRGFFMVCRFKNKDSYDEAIRIKTHTIGSHTIEVEPTLRKSDQMLKSTKNDQDQSTQISLTETPQAQVDAENTNILDESQNILKNLDESSSMLSSVKKIKKKKKKNKNKVEVKNDTELQKDQANKQTSLENLDQNQLSVLQAVNLKIPGQNKQLDTKSCLFVPEDISSQQNMNSV